MINASEKQAMIDLFQLLAEFYKFPNEDFFEFINKEDLQKEIRGLMESLKLDCDIQILRPFNSFQEMKEEYVRTFIGVDKPAAIPVESIYKVWTTDETATMGFSKNKGYYMGDSAIHIQYLLEQYQLDIPEELGKKPDHITILLELLAYIIEIEDFQTVRNFMVEHFDWLSDLMTTLEQVNGHEFYKYITELLICVIDEVKQKIL